MPQSNTVLYEKRDQVVYVTLNRPEVLNAMNRELSRTLSEGLMTYRDDNDALVAIITGDGGRAFSSGMDLKETAEEDAAGKGHCPDALPRLMDLRLWKPIIAAIDGYCLAGGLELALQCDIRIATRHSSFGLPEPRWNLMANYYGCHNLSRMIPLGEALFIQLTGGRINTDQALRCGLVHSLHPNREELMAEADRIAGEIKLCSPLAVQAIKRVVMQGRNLPVDYSYRLAEPIFAQLQQTEDAKEGPRAFAEKRRPIWKMR